MRTHMDRLRHTLLYEFFGLILCTPLAAWALDRELMRVGLMSISMSAAAMVCNYIFNLAFDHLLVRLDRPLNVRPPLLRALHALSFEIFLAAATVPLIILWLDLPLGAALLTDLGFSAFFLGYTYLYNWAYDAVFPMPVEPATQPAGD